MKTFKFLIATLLIVLGTSSYTMAIDNTSPNPKAITKFIQNELQDDYSKMFELTEEKVYIEFTVNTKGEFIVVSTSAAKDMDSFIKARLNYKFIKKASLGVGKTYTIRVEFVRSS